MYRRWKSLDRLSFLPCCIIESGEIKEIAATSLASTLQKHSHSDLAGPLFSFPPTFRTLKRTYMWHLDLTVLRIVSADWAQERPWSQKGLRLNFEAIPFSVVHAVDKEPALWFNWHLPPPLVSVFVYLLQLSHFLCLHSLVMLVVLQV